jgi:predicted GNAT family N-acyltransferase
MQIEIINAVQQDLETILELQKACYQSEAEIHDEYDIPPLNQDMESIKDDFAKMVILKGQVDGQIVASVRGFAKGGTAYIGRLIVKNDIQNQGIGKQLMNSIETVFMHCNRYELFTGFKSQKNLYLYNKLGYKEFRKHRVNDKLTLVYLEKRKESLNN